MDQNLFVESISYREEATAPALKAGRVALDSIVNMREKKVLFGG